MSSTFALESSSAQILAQSVEVFGSFKFGFEGSLIVPPGHRVGVEVSPGISLTVADIRVLLTITWYELDIPT